jgi:hypothetical protein
MLVSMCHTGTVACTMNTVLHSLHAESEQHTIDVHTFRAKAISRVQQMVLLVVKVVGVVPKDGVPGFSHRL